MRETKRGSYYTCNEKVAEIINAVIKLQDNEEYINCQDGSYELAQDLILRPLKKMVKDLEVLEIIKKSFSKNFLAERLKDAYLRNDLNDEDYEKIENWKWLENEK